MENQSIPLIELEEYLVKIGRVKEGWADNYLRRRMKLMIAHLIKSSEHKLLPHPGVYALLGVDFMIDENLNIWLLEIVISPGLDPIGEKKTRIMTDVLEGTIEIEFALLYGKDIEDIMEEREFEFVIDRRDRKNPYQDLISSECL